MDWPVSSERLATLMHERAPSAFRGRFFDVPYYLSLWTQDIGFLSGKKVLDYGCGTGETTCGVGLFHNPLKIIGVDTANPSMLVGSILANELDTGIPANVGFHVSKLGDPLPDDDFDFVYSWSLLHRVQNVAAIADSLYRCTRIGGRLLIQVAPLFLSPYGTTLEQFGVGPWEHLHGSLNDLHDKVFGSDQPESEKQQACIRYCRLNRVTPTGLRASFERAGFYQIRSYETRSEIEPPSDLRLTYNVDALLKDQVVMLFCKA